VLQAASDKAGQCYYRAAEARERALREHDPVARATWLKIEERWIALAQRNQAPSEFSGEIRGFLRRRPLP